MPDCRVRCYLQSATPELVLPSEMSSTKGRFELYQMEGELIVKQKASIASERKSERGIRD